MPEQYDNELSGVLFRNKKQAEEAEGSPDYRGRATIQGVEYRISGWVKESKKGEKYFSFSFDPPKDPPAVPQTATIPQVDETDDDIPF